MPDSDPDESALSETPSPGRVSSLNPNLKSGASGPSPSVDDVDAFVEKILGGDRVALSRAITLVESTRTSHQEMARDILNACLPKAGDSIRVGVTGVPGVGKSTFIEKLGTQLVDGGHRLAVLAIDPSSERSKGSILGDKTRMGQLTQHDDVFIRPSPTSGSLGGVARKTRETILLCEAAGYDTIFVETVGVGQSETTVHSMVDFFLLLALAGAGDELQGIKRGIVEMAHAIVINKADGENKPAAERARHEYERALHLLPSPDTGWEPPVLTCSAVTGEGIDAVWDVIARFADEMKAGGHFQKKRREQARYWMHQTIEHRLKQDFFDSEAVQARMEDLEARVLNGTLTSFVAAEELLDAYRFGRNDEVDRPDA
jgi:LAO/AO transport system kinase